MNIWQEIMLEFRAGKMSLQGTRVVPDARKGLVRIARGEEGLIHFQWLDRSRNTVEDDQIVFPDEALFEKVNQSSDRVYILKFNSDDRKLFFWMQEPRAEGDAELCSSVNQYLNQPLERFGASETMSTTRSDITDDGNCSGGDGGGVRDQEEKKIVLQITFGNDVRYFQMKRNRLLNKLMKFFCELQNLDFDKTVFLCNGRLLRPEHTPDEADMKNGDEIEALNVDDL